MNLACEKANRLLEGGKVLAVLRYQSIPAAPSPPTPTPPPPPLHEIKP